MSRFVYRAVLSNISRNSVPHLARSGMAIPMRAFSTRSLLSKDTVSQLSEIVKSEYKIANSVDNELEPEQQEYLKNSGFEISEKKYDSHVELKKTLPSGEEVRVFFDIDEVSDVSLAPPDLASEEGLEDKEQFDEELDQYENTFANIKVFLSKPSSNDGLFFNLMLQNSEEELFIDYFNYKPDASKFLQLVKEEGTFLTASEYQGPQFSNLDESLQLAMENYLEDNGIDSQLADFIFSFSEVKEEASYRNLLADVSKYLSH